MLVTITNIHVLRLLFTLIIYVGDNPYSKLKFGPRIIKCVPSFLSRLSVIVRHQNSAMKIESCLSTISPAKFSNFCGTI